MRSSITKRLRQLDEAIDEIEQSTNMQESEYGDMLAGHRVGLKALDFYYRRCHTLGIDAGDVAKVVQSDDDILRGLALDIVQCASGYTCACDGVEWIQEPLFLDAEVMPS